MAAAARLLLGCLLLAAAGCAQKIMVTVDAAGPALAERRYALVPGASGADAEGCFAAYGKQAARLLEAAGCRLAADGERATALIFLSCSEDRRERPGREESRLSVGIGAESGDGRGRTGLDAGLGLERGQARGEALPFSVWRIALCAVDLGAAGDQDAPDGAPLLWSVTVTASGRNTTPSSVFPALLEAARPYIGRDFRGPVAVTLENGAVW